VPPRITHPIAISIYYTSILHIGACTLHLLALHYDKPEGIRTDSTRTHIDPCTTHVSRTNTEQLLGGKKKKHDFPPNIGMICAACACYEA
jgi:hypothetical protein